MANKIKEYRGHHTMKSAAPRPFVDDEAELNNYLEKNRYGGEGNHYSKDSAMPNPNRTRFAKFEENMNEDNVRPQVEDDVERFLTAILKKYKDNGYTEASIAQIVDQSLTRMKRRNMGEDAPVTVKTPEEAEEMSKRNIPSIFDKDADKIKFMKENTMKKSDLLKDYMSSRKGTNLNEQMETHRKKANKAREEIRKELTNKKD